MTTGRPIVLFSSLALQSALNELLSTFTARTGIPVDATFDPTSSLHQRLHEGARPDVIIGATEALAALVTDGAVTQASPVPLARTGIGLATRTNTPAPPISSIEQLVAILLNARSVAYSRNGASGVYFAKILQRLGIDEPVNANATIIEKGFAATCLLDGRADLAVQQLSELKAFGGIQLVGPLPAEIQHYTDFAAAVGAGARHSKSGHLIDYLTSCEAHSRYNRLGLEPPQN